MKISQKFLKSIDKILEQYADVLEPRISDSYDKNTNEVKIEFPRDTIYISWNDFYKYIPELDSLEFDVYKAKTKKISQYVVYSYEQSLDYLLSEIDFKVTSKDGYSIKIVENPILIGFAAVKLDKYDKYLPPCSSYHALEIVYDNISNRLKDDEEIKIAKSFLFEFSYVAKCLVDFGYIRESGYYEAYEESALKTYNLTQLPKFCEPMDLFRKALGALDNEIKFLYFYKVIEYYSPIAAQIEVNDTLVTKIESMKYREISQNDLNSVLMIAENYKKSLSDKELAQTLLLKAIDILQHFDLLPTDIQKRVLKTANIDPKHLDYKIKRESLNMIINQIGIILYSTRNSIVHAKSNYIKNNNEVSSNDLEQMNAFLYSICYSLIYWNNNLQNHLRLS